MFVNKRKKTKMKFDLTLFNKIKPEVFFALVATFFGLVFLFITPPFQSPDEINHFYRAYQISEGHLKAVQQDNRVGGEIPKSLIQITEPFIYVCFNKHVKTNYKTIAKQFKIPLEADKKVFVDFPNTSMYNPVSYFPQSVSIFILRMFNLPPMYLFYGARLFSLLFWIASIFFAIKTLPFYKWLFTLLALLPMSVFINMSLSADVATNIVSFLLMAYILKLAYSDQSRISITNFGILSLLVMLLAAAKLVYTPIALLYLLIPINKWPSRRAYYIQLGTLFILGSSTILFCSLAMNNLHIPYSDYNEQFRDGLPLIKCANMHEQTQYILSHGFYIFQVFINSMKHAFDMYYQGYIGTFGWLDTKLPLWFIRISYVILIFVALTDRNTSIHIKPWHKLVMVAGFTISLCLILLSQHLTWDCVGGDIISTIQGRYFISIFPLLFMLLYNRKFNLQKFVVPTVVIYALVGLSFTTHTLYARYYVSPITESVTINCDAENISKEGAFATNIPSIFLENGQTQNSEKARSGIFSAKLTPQNQYGFTYRLNNCKEDDQIQVEAWRYGTEGEIVITGDQGALYLNASEPTKKDSSGWECIQINYTVPDNMHFREIGIYLFYNGKDSTYFDDLKINYQKRQ